MKQTTMFWIPMAVALLSGWDAITRNINTIVNGFTTWWNTLAPLAQLVVVGLFIWFIYNKK